MGRLLREQDIVQDNIKKYIERAASDYTRYLDTKPTFVTYYQRDVVGSTYDKGLENVEKYVGKDSPNKFKKIENLPIYGIDNLSLSMSREDRGMDISYEGDGIIIPNTISPYPEDFFTIEYIGEIYLFKINNINKDGIKGKPFFKIEFSFFKILEDERDIDEQISDEYTLIFKNIGAEDRAIVKKEDYLNIDYLDKLYNKLYTHFVKYFFDRKLNVVSFESKGFKLYNRHLNKFIMDNELLKMNYEYMDSIYLVDVMQEDISFFELYKKSIYYALQQQDTSSLEGEFIFPMIINDVHTPFAQYSYNYHTVNFMENDLDGKTINIFPESFIGRLKIDQVFMDDEHIIENMVIDYAHNRLELKKGFLDTVNKLTFYPDEFSYVFIPILMYIFKDLKNKLLIRI